MLINLQEIKDFVSISAVADYLGLEEEYGKRKFPGERTASIELYPNTQTFYDFGRAVGGDIFDLLSHIKGIGFKEALDEIVDFFKIEVSTSENEETSGRENHQKSRDGCYQGICGICQNAGKHSRRSLLQQLYQTGI